MSDSAIYFLRFLAVLIIISFFGLFLYSAYLSQTWPSDRDYAYYEIDSKRYDPTGEDYNKPNSRVFKYDRRLEAGDIIRYSGNGTVNISLLHVDGRQELLTSLRFEPRKEYKSVLPGAGWVILSFDYPAPGNHCYINFRDGRERILDKKKETNILIYILTGIMFFVAIFSMVFFSIPTQEQSRREQKVKGALEEKRKQDAKKDIKKDLGL